MFMFQTLLKILIALVIVIAIGIGILGRERMLELVLGPVTYSPIEFETLQRHANPNQYLLCPSNLCTAKPDATSPSMTCPTWCCNRHGSRSWLNSRASCK